jgi:AcrR family transcriptional regulator
LATKKSEATRQRILDAALRLFGKHGFERTTMREVAAAAGVALGAAYYYFPSKDALLVAYYLRIQDEHERRARALLPGARGLRARLGVVMHTKLDVVHKQRKLMGALFRTVADPTHPLSVFARGMESVRQQSVAIFDESLAGGELPADLHALLVLSLWTLHVGFLLYFMRDTSAGQKRTRRLIDDTLDLVVPLVELARMPMAAPLVAQVLAALAGAGLWDANRRRF